MAEGEGLLSEIGEDLEGVAETGIHAAEGIYDAATGNWDGAADNAVSTTEGALGVATGGISTAVEAGWDTIAKETGLPTAHDAIKEGTQAVGDALGDGLFDLVGADQAHQSAVAFDNGDILGGIGHMAEGAAHTIGGALEDGVSAIGEGLGDLFSGGQSDQPATADASQANVPATPAEPDPGGYDASYDQGYDPGAEAIY